MIIDGFTKLLRISVNNNDISTDINKFDNFTKFYKKIESICYNIYNMIFDNINEKIEQIPLQRMNSVKLVRTYAEMLLSNIHEYTVNDVSKLIKNKIVNGIEKLDKLGFIDMMSNHQSCLERLHNETVENDDNIETIDSLESRHRSESVDKCVPTIKYNEVDSIVDNQQSCFRSNEGLCPAISSYSGIEDSLERSHNVVDNVVNSLDSFDNIISFIYKHIFFK